jgi:P-type Ca2+ transporter type 2C
MPGSIIDSGHIQGLSDQDVLLQRSQYGKNIFDSGFQHRFLKIAWGVFREPMFILLSIACLLYFILGNTAEGVMMAIAMGIVTAISLYQEVKSSRALESLKQFTEPKVTVIRQGRQEVINNEDLVPGDIMLLEEGMKIPADATVIQSNDLSINESIITGESLPVDKNSNANQDILYQGTTINSGKCVAKVKATGNNTVLSSIGKAVMGNQESKTLLQLQINKFVRRLALFGLAGFLIIFLVNYIHYRELATSLLFALTLAMSAVPEEIPVAFSSFMALGTYKMSKLGIISRQPQIIENLGAINVLCLDKTGTITENTMQVTAIYDYDNDEIINLAEGAALQNESILLYAALASESEPFDAMEKAIWKAFDKLNSGKQDSKAKMIYEYPLEGRPPMMTHVYQSGNDIIVAAKGAAERIIRVCRLDAIAAKKIKAHILDLAAKGYRVLGVAAAKHIINKEWPSSQDDFNWEFLGLVALYDPPKKNIASVLKKIKDAGIEVKLLTGDYPETAVNIAKQVSLTSHCGYMNGEEVTSMTTEGLQKKVKDVSVFARMFPDAKVRVINAIKANGDIVAMTGDGVNDGPALKASDIGIAMGEKGTETARQASDLVITDDDLEKIASAVSEGRKIFNNLVKAIRYIIAIHIPIILTASLPVILGWEYPNIFTPIHVIFLELIMGPTCSIFFEREPVEKDLMQQPPRNRNMGLFSWKELIIGIVQGLTITAGVLSLYYIFMNDHYSIEETRTIVFTVLILANVFLTFASRSFTKTLFYTARYKNSLAPAVILISTLFIILLHYNQFVRNLFKLAPVSASEFWFSFVVAFASVMWFEVYKVIFQKKNQK